jgi:hypothetical protein
MVFLPCNPEPKSPIDGIIEVSAIMTGVHVIVAAGGQFIQNWELAPLVNSKPWDGPQALSEDIVPAFDAVKSKVTATYSHQRGAVYLKSIEELHRAFRAVVVNPDHLPIFFVFLILVSREYIDMLKETDPMALVILAHFGVVCQASSRLWWARDWDHVILNAVHEALDNEWRKLIAWPTKCIKERLQNLEQANNPRDYCQSLIVAKVTCLP